MAKNNAIYAQVKECASLLEEVDMRLNDLRATLLFLGEGMGSYTDEISRVMSLISGVVADTRGTVGEALGCAMRARGYLTPEPEAESA